jgi:HK97 family phage major capsid protein
MMNDATLAAIRKLDYGTADARPLYQISAMAGQPDMIEGVKVFVNNAMPAMTAGLKPIICGDFNQYKIRRVNGLRFKTLYELYAGTDQIGMDLLWRWDAFVLNAGTNPIKHLIMAAS